jgi:hypothetical protein
MRLDEQRPLAGVEPLEPRRLMSGDGLLAQFFNKGQTEPAAVRVDATVESDWGKASPDPAVKPNKFTAVWTGQVEAPASGTYTFTTLADDGTRLFIDGQLVIDNLKGAKLREASGALTLSGGTRHEIRLEFYERKAAAQVKLLWSSESIAKSVVPQSALFSGLNGNVPTPPTVPQPSPGGRTIVVDRAGPIASIERAADFARPGDVVLVRPGRYFESFTIPGSGGDNAERPITIAAAEPGTVVIDGTGHATILRCGQASFVHLRGLVFEHADGPIQSAAVELSEGWVMADCVVRNTDAQGAIVYATGAQVLRSTFEYNGQEGLGGVNCAGVLVQDCVTRFNNRGLADPVWAGAEHAILKDGLWYVDPSFEAGAGKWLHSRGVTMERVTSHGNGGPGIWFDFDNADVTIRDCTVYDNVPVLNFYESIGINIELTQGPTLLEGNTVRNHSGANLLIQSSSDVTARDNTLENGPLALHDYDRGEEYKTRRVFITDNRLTKVKVVTGGEGWTRNAPGEKAIILDRNVYSGTVGGDLFEWGGEGMRSLAAVRSALGLEREGRGAT